MPLLLTCGAIEENLANNQMMAEKSTAAGDPTTFLTVHDAHNTIVLAGRLAPHLDRLSTR